MNRNRSRLAPQLFAATLLGFTLMACSPTADLPAEGAVQLEATQAGIVPTLKPQAVATPNTGGWVINDPDATDGQAVILLGTRDAVRFVLPKNLKTRAYTVSIVGRGEAYQGAPIVELTTDDGVRVGTATLDNATYDRRTFGRATLHAGQTVTLSFLNDAYDGPGKDRNAVVDYLVLNQSHANGSDD
ncbi:carbohydrate-binding domain-containing protein [Deinococcus maricopensis]|uniref:Carbohydrate binding module xylan-binding domain-containing protein n=1 Tax=Deinococcus maricopensis (strain DSM 21211 / LMG 22137 / NRRL B-23946 / LB-34) TaxID=709986 RepID=E8U4S5_DEIML|nr:carbohydrate-binding domain-containing protein [Deinococcus maricopensis]ADV66064.1 hypothetical protein Deima_0404 [Deinococcus maricopensis DSM 21211]